MNRVVMSPELKAGCVISALRKSRFVLTPRMRYSRSARLIRATTSSGVGAHAVIFSSRES
jgi:hypothetical protein